jgi:hypothetical protein
LANFSAKNGKTDDEQDRDRIRRRRKQQEAVADKCSRGLRIRDSWLRMIPGHYEQFLGTFFASYIP